MSKTTNKFAPEVRERAVRMVVDHERDYLYAAFSLKRGEGSGLSTEEAQAVERWRNTIMGMAIEEIGHLVPVANLCVVVGARPHFDRPNFPIAPAYFPSGVVLRLTPSTRKRWNTSSSSRDPRASRGRMAIASIRSRNIGVGILAHSEWPTPVDARW